MKTRIAFLSLAAALVLFLAGPALAGEAKSLTILFSGDIQGWSSPIPTCGGRNMGGMARVVTERARIEAKSGPVLLLDAGGFYPLNVFGPYVAEEVYRVGLKAMQATGFDAANLSAADLVQGYATLRKSQAELNLPLVTTNVVFAGTKVPLMAPFIVKDVGGVKVGILGPQPRDGSAALARGRRRRRRGRRFAGRGPGLLPAPGQGQERPGRPALPLRHGRDQRAPHRLPGHRPGSGRRQGRRQGLVHHPRQPGRGLPGPVGAAEGLPRGRPALHPRRRNHATQRERLHGGDQGRIPAPGNGPAQGREAHGHHRQERLHRRPGCAQSPLLGDPDPDAERCTNRCRA